MNNFIIAPRASLIFGFLLISTSSQSGPLGSPYLVTNLFPGAQEFSVCKYSFNGDKVVLWQSQGTPKSSFVRHTDGGGNKIGAIVDMPVGNQSANSFGSSRTGNYVIANTVPIDTGNSDVYATVYSRTGDIIVNKFKVNDLASQNLAADVSMNLDGNFVVSWMSASTPQRIYIKRFSSAGVALAPQQIVASGSNIAPRGLGLDLGGNVAIAYWSSTGNSVDVLHARFNSATKAISSPVTVGPNQIGDRVGGRMSMNNSGNYSIVWENKDQNGAGWSAYSQLYNSSGNRVGNSIKLNVQRSDFGLDPDVAIFDDNSYLVTWVEKSGGLRYIKSRRVMSNGNAEANESVIASDPVGLSGFHSICADPNGYYSVIWRIYKSQSGNNLYMQDFASENLPEIVGLKGGQSVSNTSALAGAWKYYKISVPSNTKQLKISTSSVSGGGDADLYVRYGMIPDLNKWDIRPYMVGSNESVVIANPPPGSFYIGVYAYAGYAAVNVNASYN